MHRSSRHEIGPVERYALDVVNGRVPAGELVRLACERHLSDLETGQDRGLVWRPELADYAIRFFSFLRHSKGEWAGQPFELEPWQQFIVGSLWGWTHENGLRRYRVAYDEVSRKNGKSTVAAGVGLLLFVGDGEPGAEVYTAATKRDQARITHSEATRMVKASPSLRKRVKVYKDNLSIEGTASKFEPLGADADTMDGLNIHGAIVDELHAHRTRDVWDKIETATGARRQPLVFAITTAGSDQQSICYQQHEYAERVLRGTIQDDHYFAYISTIDKGDDWADPKAWAKANPNLGISVSIEDLARKAKQAKEMPAAQNAFMRLHLNVWTQQVDRWISLHLWDGNNLEPIDEERFRGRACYGGLDLSSVSDISAWALLFPDEGDPDRLDVLVRCWCPEARLNDTSNRYRDQYRAWAQQGFLKATPGDAIDYSFIKQQILEDAQKFRIIDINIDRLFQAHQLAMELIDEGLMIVGFGMGFYSMATPMKEFERLLLSNKLNHGGNPVLRWMADNVSVKQDPAGNLKPDKATSQGKIDGIVAIVMALDRAMRHTETRSVYEERGIYVL